MKKSIILFAVLISVIFNASANNDSNKDSSKKAELAASVKVLTPEEANLSAELEAVTDLSVEQILASLGSNNKVEKAVIYNQKGELVSTLEGKKLNINKIEAQADLLMTEGTTAFYILK